nr:hypothetical protein [Sedimenticola selenatireducens]
MHLFNWCALHLFSDPIASGFSRTACASISGNQVVLLERGQAPGYCAAIYSGHFGNANKRRPAKPTVVCMIGKREQY